MTKYRVEHVRTELNKTVNFTAKDAKGRTIGCVATIREVDAIESPDWGYPLAHGGRWFDARVQACRHSVPYGATQGGEFFDTLAAAEAYVARRIAASEKAAKARDGR